MVCVLWNSKLRERGRDVQHQRARGGKQHIKERQAILASDAVPFAPAELDHLGLAQRVLTQPEVIRAI